MTAWIWDAFHRETPNQLVVFRRVVETDEPIVDGALEIAARGSFRVWVDGVLVAHHDVQSAAPGAESVRCDLTAALGGRHPRTTTIVVGVYLLAVGTHHQPRCVGGLWVEGALRHSDGTLQRIDSDSRWSTHVPASWRQNTPQMVWSAGFTEWTDLTVEPADLPAGTGEGWGAAVEYADDQRPRHLDRDVTETDVPLGPFRTETGTILTPDDAGVGREPAVDRAAACVMLGAYRLADAPAGHAGASGGSAGADALGRYDLFVVPHQLVGFLTLDVDAAEPTTIDVIAGEALDDHGWPTATRQSIGAVDTVVVPEGRSTHRFWHRRTFRTLAVIAHGTGAVSVEASFAMVTAERPAVAFGTEVDRYDRMHAVSIATASVGRQDLYEDCPLREGGHYVADARLQALFDLATTGVPTTSRRSVLQFASAQDDDGMIPALSPSGTRHRIPDFALQWPTFVEDHVRFTGDLALLDEVYPAVVRCLDWAAAHVDPTTGRLDVDQPGWWPFIDWYAFTPEDLQAAIDAQHAVALRSAAALAEAVGDAVGATAFRSRLDDVLAALAGPAGVVEHPHAATILLCGLDPARARSLVAPSVLDGFAPETGYFMFSVCRAHLVLGDPAAARDLLDTYWGSMLDAGAGTWWERWSPTREVVESTGSSLCHPWSAGPLVLLPMLALGIDPFARVEADTRFAPVDLGGPVSARLHTPWGVVGE